MANNIHKTSKQERRQYVRLNQRYILSCKIVSTNQFLKKDQGAWIKGTTNNQSVGGALFESQSEFNIGTLLKLSIELPGWEKYHTEFHKNKKIAFPEPLEVLGRVVRVEMVIPDQQYDIGVVFSALAEDQRQALNKFINEKMLEV